MIKLRDKSGLSLAEFIVYFAIISVIFTITLQLISQMLRISERNKVIQEVQENIRFATGSFSQAVRKGIDVCTPTSGASALTADIRSATCVSNSGNKTVFQVVSNELQVCDTKTVNPDGCASSSNFVAVTSGRVEVLPLTGNSNYFFRVDSNGKITLRMEIKIRYKNPNNNPLFDYSLEAKTNAALQK